MTRTYFLPWPGVPYKLYKAYQLPTDSGQPAGSESGNKVRYEICKNSNGKKFIVAHRPKSAVASAGSGSKTEAEAEKKDRDGENGDGKSGTGKSVAGKSGAGKSGDGKSGDGKNGNGKNDEDKGSDNKNSDGKNGNGKNYDSAKMNEEKKVENGDDKVKHMSNVPNKILVLSPANIML